MNIQQPFQPYSFLPDELADSDENWQQLRPGVKFKTLFADDNGYTVGLIYYDPGATVPQHIHTGDEHIYVLSGSQEDERGLYPAGSYIYNPEGSVHSIKSSNGCLVLAHWFKPVRFLES